MATYPLAAVRRVEVTRHTAVRSDWSTMRLYVDGAQERSRPGPADLPERWVDAFTAAEVDLHVREVQDSD